MWANPNNMPSMRYVCFFIAVAILTFCYGLLTPKAFVLILISIGVIGFGYFFYKFIDSIDLCDGLSEDVEKPWGGYRDVADNPKQEGIDNYKVKILCVKPDECTSLQSHEHRKEVWVVAHGTATVDYGNKEFILKTGDTIKILEGYKHRINNNHDEMLVIVEVWFGKHLSEDDITRYEDKYGRS
jgi:mannose-6-phosphate isomerase-like protein (cupin superfamily)